MNENGDRSSPVSNSQPVCYITIHTLQRFPVRYRATSWLQPFAPVTHDCRRLQVVAADTSAFSRFRHRYQSPALVPQKGLLLPRAQLRKQH